MQVRARVGRSPEIGGNCGYKSLAPEQRSKAAVKKQTTGVTPDGLPAHSFRTLLADLATLARNTIVTAINPLYPLTVVTRPMPVPQKAFDLLSVAV